MLNEVDGEYTLLIVNFIYSSLQFRKTHYFIMGSSSLSFAIKVFSTLYLARLSGVTPMERAADAPVTFPVLEVGFGQQDGDTAHLAFHATAVYRGIVGTHDGTEEVPVGNGIAVQ